MLQVAESCERRRSEAENAETIPIDHGLNPFSIKARQGGPIEHPIQTAQTIEGGIDGRKRMVATGP